MNMTQSDWYDTRLGRLFYWGILVATLLAVLLSMVAAIELQIPSAVYLFGFMGATVYAFTSFAKQFDEDGRYRLKILSRTIAVLPLATGVYLLAFAFPGVSGELAALDAATSGNGEVTAADRLVAGLVFLVGIYVSATLKALGGIAERLLGESPERDDDERAAPADAAPDDSAPEPQRDDDRN